MIDNGTSNMFFKAVGRTLVVVHNKDYPTDAEWDAYLKLLRDHLRERDRRSIVVTPGGAPSTKQRARMSEMAGDHMAPTSVLTSSTAVQATVGALHLRNPDIRAFAPEDMEGALTHLGLRPDERHEVLSVLPAMQQQVGEQS